LTNDTLNYLEADTGKLALDEIMIYQPARPVKRRCPASALLAIEVEVS
jgi:hypothetical protein